MQIDYSEIKNQILKQTRGVGFEDIIEAIRNGQLLDDVEHFNKTKYSNQRILIIKFVNYVYAVPYVIDKDRNMVFLKTIFPSRVLKKKYLK